MNGLNGAATHVGPLANVSSLSIDNKDGRGDMEARGATLNSTETSRYRALTQPPIVDLKRQSVVGAFATLSAQGAEVCLADSNDDGVGAVAVAERFWITGNGGRADRFSGAFPETPVWGWRPSNGSR